MQLGYPPVPTFFLLCGLIISCWCVCYAPMAPDWFWATCWLVIGLTGFSLLEYATKDRVEVHDLVQRLLLLCICIMSMCSCLLALAKFYSCIIWVFTQIWETKGVRDVRRDVIELSEFMELGGVAWIVCLVALVLSMQFPWACPV